MVEEKRDDEKYSEEHRRRIMEGREASGNRGGRPRKEINVETVIARLNQGVPLTEIAAGQHMSVKTLKERMAEAKIIMVYGEKERVIRE